MPRFFRSISAAVFIFISSLSLYASDLYPDSIGAKTRAEMMIEMPKAYASGILIMAREDESTIKGSLINEFGLSLLDFTYNEKKAKVKLHHVMKKMDKWYIKRVLKGDLKHVMSIMQSSDDTEYYNKKRKIKYTFTPLNEAAE